MATPTEMAARALGQNVNGGGWVGGYHGLVCCVTAVFLVKQQ